MKRKKENIFNLLLICNNKTEILWYPFHTWLKCWNFFEHQNKSPKPKWLKFFFSYIKIQKFKVPTHLLLNYRMHFIIILNIFSFLFWLFTNLLWSLSFNFLSIFISIKTKTKLNVNLNIKNRHWVVFPSTRNPFKIPNVHYIQAFEFN